LISERELVITDDKINVGKAEEFISPYFGYDGERLIVTHLNLENDNYLLEIYDDQGLVYETHFGSKSPIRVGFDLSQLEAGNYKVYMNSKNNDFNYSFKKLN